MDIQAQERWDDFTEMKYKMLRDTHTNQAPWTVIRSNDKHQARLNAMRVILNSVPYERGETDLDFVPDPDIVISGAREVEQMEAERIRLARELHDAVSQTLFSASLIADVLPRLWARDPGE